MHLDGLDLPLTLRPWTGDRIQTLGMDGHRVSDILDRRGVAHGARSALMVVQANGCPAWLVGHRIDRRAALPHPGGAEDRCSC